MKIKTKILMLCILCTSLIGCDMVTKDLAKQHLMYSRPTSYLYDTFRLEYAENTGAALSLGDGLPQPYSFIVLSLLPLLFMIGMMVYMVSRIKQLDTLKLICLAMVFAGGIGNLIDRIFHDRHVVDFMNIGIGSLRSGIFNVADVCISLGVVGLIIAYNKPEPKPATAIS